MVNLPIVNAPYLAVDGLQITITGNTTAAIQPGQARNSTNENDIVISDITLVDAANVGVNGVDNGALLANTLYEFYVIGDSTGNSPSGFIVSAGTASPILPVGYDMYRLIAYFRTDGSSHFSPGFFHGKSNERIFIYETPIATAVTAGAATTYTSVSLVNSIPRLVGDYVPVFVSYAFTPGAASRTLDLSASITSGGSSLKVTGQVTAVVVSGTGMVLSQSGTPAIFYKVSNAGDAVALSVSGYQYTI